jgi:CspA family cold shock protein
MAVGKVKWFNDEKGWGFIKQDNGADVFVHYSQISGDGRRRLFEDETVEFEIKEGPKGLQAINVVRQEGAAPARSRFRYGRTWRLLLPRSGRFVV